MIDKKDYKYLSALLRKSKKEHSENLSVYLVIQSSPGFNFCLKSKLIRTCIIGLRRNDIC